jgi:hypothetical protein
MLFLAAPALAAEETPAPAPTTNSRDVVVCKRVPPATGTRFGATKVCRTQGQWDDQRAEDRAMTERAQEGDSRGSPGN